MNYSCNTTLIRERCVTWLAIACGAIQVGGFLLRDSFLRVGVYGYPV